MVRLLETCSPGILSMARFEKIRRKTISNSLTGTLVLAQTQYASEPTPKVPILSASSPWLTTTKPTATFGMLNTPRPAASSSERLKDEFPSYFNSAKIVHAALGALAFLFVFPFGGIIIKVWPHRYI